MQQYREDDGLLTKVILEKAFSISALETLSAAHGHHWVNPGSKLPLLWEQVLDPGLTVLLWRLVRATPGPGGGRHPDGRRVHHRGAPLRLRRRFADVRATAASPAPSCFLFAVVAALVFAGCGSLLRFFVVLLLILLAFQFTAQGPIRESSASSPADPFLS